MMKIVVRYVEKTTPSLAAMHLQGSLEEIVAI